MYKKLVRDKIPSIIEKTGRICRTETLALDEYRIELQKKLREDLEIYLRASNDEEAIETLADLLEVVYALAEAHGSTLEELETLRLEKVTRRGGFTDRVFLIDIQD